MSDDFEQRLRGEITAEEYVRRIEERVERLRAEEHDSMQAVALACAVMLCVCAAVLAYVAIFGAGG